ncbi:cytochrome d ubiquinol oxidase subunit II [Propionispira arboris]|uniref:Cytochrome d ubiquinol oxidase subunit II n=1 Tax=Propionispira arboris TaxID=84035 RepID=A0A1H6ZXV4_9FIRM|nr:cytochrome d ubiquinol oxidase subunit II [Propionispira arboris]SEJ56457.1 cytochrome d ubiquinol oxidase subunit II [Propionispira arboris]
MDLTIIWFVLITVLFIGFFFLEGFDYGVGILLPFIAKTDQERRIIINTIGPVWDGNEVWMITAGGALFAAFPHVYATMFSTFYLALFLMLLALIMRGVSFEFRSKHENKSWRSFWDWMIFFGSAVPALLWGVAVTNLIQGLAINEKMIYTGTFFDLLTPYTIVGGLTFVLVFTFHGAVFLMLRVESAKTIAALRQMAQKIGIPAALVFVLCMILTYTNTSLFSSMLAASSLCAAAIVFLASYGCVFTEKYVPAFVLSSLAIVFTTLAFFAGLFPRLMVSSLNPDWSLTIYNASSSQYTLGIMTVAALVLVPIVLIYQGWTYWIFRKRVSGKHLEY